MVLLKSSFSMVMYAVLVLMSPRNLMRLNPGTSLVLFGSTFWGIYMLTIFPLVIYFILSVAIVSYASFFFLVTFTMLPTSCGRHPNFLMKDICHVSLFLLCLMRCLYSNYSPVFHQLCSWPAY